MSLTGSGVLILGVVLTVLSVAGTVWIWPRLAKRHWWAFLGRIGTIVVTQVLLICTLGLWVNDSFSFYSSWSDLLGIGAKGPVTVGAGAGAGHTASGSGLHGPAGAQVQVLGQTTVASAGIGLLDPAKAGKLERVRFPGTVTGLTTDGYVYLPPQYFQPAYAKDRFPVLVSMTGFPGEATNLVTKLQYPSIELQLIQQGKIKPMIQVLMQPSPSMPRDSECEDIPNGPQAETYFTADVPLDVENSYRVRTDGRGFSAIGDSTGGYCALKLAMRNPALYATAASLSGYFKAAEDVTTGDLFGGSQLRRNEADLSWRMQNLPAPPVALMLASSKQDGDTYALARSFAALVRPPTTVAEATVDTGGHNFTTWVRLLPACLTFLSDHLPEPAP
ncbi:alpha/beta hydrolase [Streptacidiphilus fuscans]|uniref:Esterase n=1 Tax=Streptacidiphilus fuscans TaxID=2789292 RepID=A0A931BA66_9ACTN|nr:alpha/beta hydrolase-fold protein [Streptacidiphilus fuscans]MBF9069705.1 esterase [Streptacidiphilus fuscans]